MKWKCIHFRPIEVIHQEITIDRRKTGYRRYGVTDLIISVSIYRHPAKRTNSSNFEQLPNSGAQFFRGRIFGSFSAIQYNPYITNRNDRKCAIRNDLDGND